ncbi:MAG: energy transducer TonB [Nitrospirae bacterium]|nr:energy transducer TonB [Nitrospirota bacterium]
MGISKQPFLKFIGISAGLHLAIGGLIIFFVLKTVRTIPSVSVIQVVLVSPVETVPVAAKSLRLVRTPPVSSSPPPVQPRPSEPVEAEAADSINAESVISAPAREQSRMSSAESPALEGSGTRDEEAAGNGSRSEELTRFLQDVRSRLEQAKRYPWLARIQGQEGTARVQFMINASGEIQEIRLLESSRSKILDEEAVTTVKRLGRFSRLPVSWNEKVRVQVPLVFQLNLP